MILKKKNKLAVFLVSFLLSLNCCVNAQVGVNILTPHPSAALQIEAPAGTAKGLLTPSMTTAQRMSVTTGTHTASDGLIVYDKDHHMHYYYNAGLNRWVSMSPLTLSTPTLGSTSFPSGVITTPSSSAVFSLGINKQNPTQALDVIGNATLSGNALIGGNVSVSGSLNVTGTVSVIGFAANPLVPTGAIIMWSGTLIPVGWAVCDGGTYNGLTTPDLRGRFIIGIDNSPGAQYIPTGQYLALGVTGLTPTIAPNDGTTLNYGVIGNKGGENGHVLSLSEMPQHKHNVTSSIINGSQGNSLAFQFNSGCSGCSTTQPGGSGQNIQENYLNVTTTESLQGSNQTHENRPPYYVLAYIIKLP